MSLREDLKHLRRWLLFCLAALLLCGGLAFGAWRYAVDAALAQRQALAQSRELETRRAEAAADAKDAVPLAARYRAVTARPWIGDERRLAWIERIAQIKQARRLFDIRYELAPRQTAAPEVLPSGSAAGGFDFMTSTMKLQMQLLHEEDLLGFLDDLAADVPALLRVRACKLERIAPDAVEAGVVPRLAAACTLDWITLRERT